ncbi:hypothetical protein [Mucilaginibacter sp. PAMB04168]|uniref:hypothetical protein n=1 Tax=Mucilaginibacter sp. PAMB04168 TaxID=3138567 RepID=UPI0031F6EC3B
MKLSFLRHTWQKFLAAAFVVFLLMVTVVAYFVNRHWAPILATELRNTVLASSDSLYQADFTDAELHIVQGKVIVHNLTLKPNLSVYNRQLARGIAPNNLYTLKVKRIVFKHIHPLKLYYKRKLDITQIVLSAPELRVSYQLNHQLSKPSQKKISAWQRIKGLLKSVHIGEVMLNDVKLTYQDYSGNKLDISELKEMNLTGKDLLIDSVTQFDSTRFYYFKDVQAELNNFSRPADNGLYTYRINQLQYSTLTSQLKARGVALLPAADSVFFNRHVRTWFQFDADTLNLSGFDFKKYNKVRSLNAARLLIGRSNLTVFSNPEGQSKKGDRLITYPHVAIRQVKSNFKLDTVDLHRIHITYNGYGKKSHKPGYVSFYNTEGRIFNITNDSAALKRNPITLVKLRSYLMESGPVEAEVSFNLTDSAKSFTYKGSVGPMDLEKMNKATMPFGLIKIASGKLDRLSFDFKADRYKTKGKVSFLYHDLKVRILKMDTLADRYRHRTIASILANALVVKRHNPDFLGGTPRETDVTYIRQPDTPFFKTVWKSLAIGIKAGAGYDAATEKMVKQHIAQRIDDKKRRELRRQLRRQRQGRR